MYPDLKRGGIGEWKGLKYSVGEGVKHFFFYPREQGTPKKNLILI